ncbi:plasma membrane-associated cation-binding protein 1 [Carica papaya]|uniref:plasma membrane-associated cation-binding protein 1 n=1 Tax=Carica papaya TaxID=3649 RepID=UPI000B8C96C7|nr:plasma membrane-associated cation-binding protein 1 [Carica papaya]
MGYWKSKVLPKIKKVFEKNPAKKAAVAEACKSFDDSKEGINEEFEEKKTDLQPKVVEIYEATSAEIKSLIKEPKEEGVKKQSAAVQKFLEELVIIEFPGSKAVSEISSKYGSGSVSGPVLFILEKVSSLVIVEDKAAAAEPPAETQTKEEVESKDKEILVQDEQQEPKKEEVKDEAPAEEAAAEPPKQQPA